MTATFTEPTEIIQKGQCTLLNVMASKCTPSEQTLNILNITFSLQRAFTMCFEYADVRFVVQSRVVLTC